MKLDFSWPERWARAEAYPAYNGVHFTGKRGSNREDFRLTLYRFCDKRQAFTARNAPRPPPDLPGRGIAIPCPGGLREGSSLLRPWARTRACHARFVRDSDARACGLSAARFRRQGCATDAAPAHAVWADPLAHARRSGLDRTEARAADAMGVHARAAPVAAGGDLGRRLAIERRLGAGWSARDSHRARAGVQPLSTPS